MTVNRIKEGIILVAFYTTIASGITIGIGLGIGLVNYIM
tara:strand:- start:460 stop:576 length:117 start_codon:yes stop_codon:yes gene_type:complete